MDLPAGELKNRVDAVVATAKKYVGDYADKGKLDAVADKETEPLTTAQVKQFVDLAQADHPYDAPALREAVGRILQKKVKAAVAAGPGEETRITYLSGAYGSRGLLRDLMQAPATEELKAVKARVDSSLEWNFDELKHLLNDEAGISLKRSRSKPPYQQYGKWRGMLSGIDITLAQIAAEHKLNFAIDNSLAPVDEKARDAVKKDMVRDGASDLRVVALALTPDEAAAAVRAQDTGVSEEQARQSARDFHAFWPDIKASAKNVLLLDAKGKVIFRQEAGVVQAQDKAALEAWDKGFTAMGKEGPAVHGLMGQPGSGRGFAR